MSVIGEVRREREELARVLKKHTGIRRIVEDLYPDSAHFIYELLQNAEDAGATEAHFALSNGSLVFEHDGRSFEPRDIYAITDIGEGTKAGDDDKIGRFGVGFKAVFAYSETPHIWSPTFSFQITDLVLPSELVPAPDLCNRTRFEFPFNNPKKPAAIAFAEVEKGLSNLAETTLLFLSHLNSISWQVEHGSPGKIVRVPHSENYIEVLKQGDGRTTNSSHFLKFDRPVKGLEKQRVAVAFALDFLPNVPSFDAERPLAKQLKVIPTHPGRVAVFFPADKEASGLRFHLHAPFVPELSRASIKETPPNLPLFEQLAKLAVSSLYQIRDLGLLTAEFLEVLPNGRDPIEERYDAIRSAIIDAMNDQPLTPTHSRSHAPARLLVQGKVSLKSLLSDEDLAFLIDYDDEPRRWTVGVAQKNSNADRFLEGLAIGTWDVNEFVDLLWDRTVVGYRSGSLEGTSRQDVMDWLRGKPVEWHQELYALLLTDHLAPEGYRREHFKTRLQSLRIVRLTDGSYGIGGESFFVSDEFEQGEVLQRVDPRVYTTGKRKATKENARAFLEQIGVREVGETEFVEAILKRRYTREAEAPDQKTYRKDLKRFIRLVEKESETASLFAGYYIFQCGDYWRTPDEVFLDQPILDTGLSAYYAALGSETDRFALSDRYQSHEVNANKLAKFALAVGAIGTLEIRQTSCRFSSNPDVQQMVWAAKGPKNRTGIDLDYQIPGLEELLKTPSAALSRLIWRTLFNQDDDSWTTASYRNNSGKPTQTGPSRLVCVLRDRAWVPQTDGRFVRPAEASRDLLPGGFLFDPAWVWLSAIHFGQQLARKSEEQLQRQTLAKQLGFNDEDALDRAQRFAALPADEQRRILADRECQASVELPDHEPTNPSRRANRVEARAADAPERITEERTRFVSVGLEALKQEVRQYLRQQYTNADGQMICQVCKNLLPFKLDDGSDYFERVEFLRGLKRRHQQNYVALCPNHAAMFQHANGSTDKLRDLVAEQAGNDVAVVLAKEDTTIYFTKTHLVDLKAIISADLRESEASDNELPDATDP
jgi:hypothetical protein